MRRPIVEKGDRVGFEAAGQESAAFSLPRRRRNDMPGIAASVLTVEDNPIIRANLRLVLEDAGFTVVADARDGVEAVELARKHQPDVILLDLGLPRLDGVEATSQILAERSVPIVALTGRAGSLAEKALDAGAVSYVLKPYTEAELVDAVRLAFDERDVSDTRAASRRALETLVGLLGYPREWAAELEQQAWDRGHVWRISGDGITRR
jgi:two-component system, response regulator PdtaR